MTVKQYVNGITGKIKCGGEKKKEIRKQLQTEVELKLSQGNSLEEII